MNMPYLCILLFFLIHGTVASKGLQPKNSSYFNELKEDLKLKWSQNNRECLYDLLDIIDGIQNSTLGAAWIWDSLQLPVGVFYGSRYHLGSWSQCMHAPPLPRSFPPPKYCLADVTLTKVQQWRPRRDVYSLPAYNQSVEDYLSTLSPYKRPMNVITWGVCVPSSCVRSSVKVLLKVLLGRSVFTSLPTPSIRVTSCELATENKKPPLGFYLFWFTVIFLVVITLFFTNIANSEHCRNNSLLNEIAKAFSIKNNAYTLVKDVKDDIPCLYGLRSITALIAVILHIILYVNSSAVINGLDLDLIIHNLRYLVSHSDSIIDTFFFMSGLLTLKGLMAKRDNPENILVFLIRRYLRFIGGLAVSVWYVASVLQHTGSGPLWHRFAGREQHYCSKHWLLNILMINNYFHVDEICHLVTWYVSADYQLTVLGVLLFYACARMRRAGRGVAAILATLAVVWPAVVTYWHRMPATFLVDSGMILDLRRYEVFTSRYTRSQYRLGPYLVGMAAGYLLSVYKPAMYKERISKRWSEFLLTIAVITAFSVSSMAAMFHSRQYNVFEAALYCATNRVIWAMAVGAIVIICEYGTPNLVSRVLSYRAWTPLSRLSYGLYLTHPLLVQGAGAVYSTHQPNTTLLLPIAINGLGVSVAAYGLSLFLWLFVEAPLINITNLIIRQFNQPPTESIKEKVVFKEECTYTKKTIEQEEEIRTIENDCLVTDFTDYLIIRRRH